MEMQVMCNYNNDNKNVKVEGHRKSNGKCMHKVTISKNSIITNSFHSYAVPTSDNYTTIGHVGDVIEAVENKKTYLILEFNGILK